MRIGKAAHRRTMASLTCTSWLACQVLRSSDSCLSPDGFFCANTCCQCRRKDYLPVGPLPGNAHVQMTCNNRRICSVLLSQQPATVLFIHLQSHLFLTCRWVILLLATTSTFHSPVVSPLLAASSLFPIRFMPCPMFPQSISSLPLTRTIPRPPIGPQAIPHQASIVLGGSAIQSIRRRPRFEKGLGAMHFTLLNCLPQKHDLRFCAYNIMLQITGL